VISKNDASMRQLAQLEKQMERRWFDLAMAEQRGQPSHVLERMYEAYLSALDAYITYQRQLSDQDSSGRMAS
jgi:hypothetical protein